VADPAVGHTLGDFRFESKLGEGGMGVVWKARDMRLDRPGALKFFGPRNWAIPIAGGGSFRRLGPLPR
jgi:hypothetical protein